jgi:hypothetical protein
MQMETHRSITTTFGPTQLALASTNISDEASRKIIDDPGCVQKLKQYSSELNSAPNNKPK